MSTGELHALVIFRIEYCPGMLIMASILSIITILLFVIYAALLVYYHYGWRSIPYFVAPIDDAPATKITVIVPARNEAENISACVQSILAQDYPSPLFEILVVDDHSTDETAEIVASFSQYNVHCLDLKDFVTDPINSYKKKAIEVAVARAAGELIVTTDADCIVPTDWLRTIGAFYGKYRPSFMAAPVSIDNGHRFIERFQALDFMTLQGITGASVYKKLHRMCNGANLAYEKSAFEAVGGFRGIEKIASGDDMLLMHKIYTLDPQRVMFLKSTAAIVRTRPVNSWKAFFNQRIRWASKADKYDDKSILPVLITVYCFNVLMLLLPAIGIFDDTVFTVFHFNFSVIDYWIFLIVLKTMIELFFLYPVSVFFQRQPLLRWFPLMQPFHIVYTVIAGWLGKFGTYQWKDRRVH